MEPTTETDKFFPQRIPRFDDVGEGTPTRGLEFLGEMGNQFASQVVGLREHTQSVLYQLAGESRLYEPALSLLAAGAVRRDDVVIDIGARVGHFSLLFRRQSGLYPPG